MVSILHGYTHNLLRTDVDFVVDLFKQIIAPNEKLHDYLEDKPHLDRRFTCRNTARNYSTTKREFPETWFTPLLFKDKDDQVSIADDQNIEQRSKV